MHKKTILGIVAISVIFFVLVGFAQTTQDKKIGEVEKKFAQLKEDVYQKAINSCEKTNEAANRVINYTTQIYTVFAVVLALFGLYFGYESIKRRNESEVILKSLKDADKYIKEENLKYNELIVKSKEEIGQKKQMLEELYKEIQTVLAEQIAADMRKLIDEKKAEVDKQMDEAGRKIKELTEKVLAPEIDGKLEQMEKRLEFFQGMLPDDPKLLMAKAEFFEEKKQYEDSLLLLEKLVKIEPKNATAVFKIAYIQALLNRDSDALTNYDKVLKLNSHVAAALNNKGVIFRKQGNVPAAIEFYKQAVAQDPKKELYLNNLISVLKEAGKIDEVVKCSQDLVAINPTRENKLKLARNLYLNKEYVKAQGEYRNIFKKQLSESCLGECEESVRVEAIEAMLVLEEYDEAERVIHKFKDKIGTEKFVLVLDYLTACLMFIKKRDKDGIAALMSLAEKLKNVSSIVQWNFDDITNLINRYFKGEVLELCLGFQKLFSSPSDVVTWLNENAARINAVEKRFGGRS